MEEPLRLRRAAAAHSLTVGTLNPPTDLPLLLQAGTMNPAWAKTMTGPINHISPTLGEMFGSQVAITGELAGSRGALARHSSAAKVSKHRMMS